MRPVRALSTTMRKGAMAFALTGSVLLAGCSGNPLTAIGGFFKGTSVEAARAEKAKEHEQAVPDENLVMPGTLTVGLPIGTVTAPFAITDNTDDSIEGIDVDLAAALASDLGLKVRYVDVGSAEAALAERACDIVMDVTPERAGSTTVLGGYYELATGFFRKGEATVVGVGDLAGKKVGLQAGSVSEGTLNTVVLDVVRQPYPNLNEAFAALDAGEVDYVLCEAYPGAYLASAYQGIAFVGAINAPTSVGVSARADNAALQEAATKSLSAITKNGVYDIVRSRWIGGMGTVSPEQVIANIQKAEHSGPNTGGAENVDGSTGALTAGANAVVVPSSDVE